MAGDARGEAPPQLFLRGADLSSLPQYEEAGIVFKDGGASRPALDIFRSHGANAIRLRLFVDPDGHGCVVNDLPYTVKLAKRAKAAGFLILLDLHYSDTWADPGHQAIPAAWKSLDYPSLVSKVREYTAGVVRTFAEAEAVPDFIQIGNEINNGLLRPLGGFDDKSEPKDQAYDRIAELLTAGIQGVHQALGDACTTKTVIHFANGQRSERMLELVGMLMHRKVPFDVIGLSFYPIRGALPDLAKTLDALATTYKKPIVIAETAYPWRPDASRSSVTSLTWPQTPEGQKQYLLALVKTLKATPDGLGIGFFYWHPESVPAGNLPLWQKGDMSLFDASLNALPGLSAFQP